jgi:adenylylsulfate kinase
MKKGQTIWLLGLPCSGKTTIGDALKEKHLPNAIRLDGDHVREGLSSGLGFTVEGRYENIRRCSEVAQLLNDQGVDVICSFVTPLISQHKLIRSIIQNVKIVYVNASAEICEERDVKGMWEKAKQGRIKGFTGYDSCFETPEADLVVDSTKSLAICVSEVYELMK